MPPKLAVRPDPHQPQQVGGRLEQPNHNQSRIIRPEANERRRDWKPNEQHWKSHRGDGHPWMAECKGDRVLRRSPECVTVALEQPNMHQPWCKMIADAVPASFYDACKFRIIQNRQLDRLDASNLTQNVGLDEHERSCSPGVGRLRVIGAL